MSQTGRASQSGTVINVSQNHESSPLQREKEVTENIEKEGTDVVEDSYKDKAAAKKHEHVRPSQQETQLEEDDLYSVTPERRQPKAMREANKPAEKSQAPDQAAQPRAPLRKGSASALDALLAKGATVQKAAPAPRQAVRKERVSAAVNDDAEEDELQRSESLRSDPLAAPATTSKPVAKGKRPSKPAEDHSHVHDEEDELASFNDDLSAPVGPHPRSSSKKTHSAASSKAAAAPNLTQKATMAPKGAPSNAASSAAALRARYGQNAAESVSTQKSNANSVLRPRDPNVQSPATAAKSLSRDARQGLSAPSTGKLKAPTKGLLARPSMGTVPSTQKVPKAKAKARAQSPVEDDDITVGPATEMKRPAVEAQAKGTLKRPAAAMKKSSKAETAAYDLPPASGDVDEDEYKPTKKARTSKATRGKKTAVASSAAKPARPTQRPARKSKAKDQENSPEQDENARPGTSASVRGRMKAASGSVVPASGRGKAPAETAKADDEMTVGVGDDEDLQYDEPETIATLPIPVKSQLNRRPIGRPSDDFGSVSGLTELNVMRNGNLGATVSRQKRPSDALTAQGGSQENAIQLSDAQSSTDGEHLHSDPSESLVQPRQRPQTPSALRSSPPVIADASTKPTTAGLVDQQSARKSTIISFDKSGPRNQGTASGTHGKPSLPAGDQSSIPRATRDGGRLADLHVQRQAVPSSTGKSAKTSVREGSAAPSYVANDAQEALWLLRKPGMASKTDAAVSDKRATRRDPSPQPECHDDGFTNVDDLTGETFINDDSYPEPRPGPEPVRSPRTLSQAQMPPPGAKSKGKQPVNRAPTVPSMLEPATSEPLYPGSRKVDNVLLGKRQQADHSETNVPQKRTRKEAVAEPSHTQKSDLEVPTHDTVVVKGVVGRAEKPSKVFSQRGASQRQPGRQKSQGTVDVGGSPVPEGMVVGGLNTVLETFSQQAALSSDKIGPDGNVLPTWLNMTSADTRAAKPGGEAVRISSNTKVLPAEPTDESQAITHVARVQPGRPFVTAETMHPPSDPFTSSADGRNKNEGGSSTSAFSEHLRQQVTNSKKTTNKATRYQEEEDDDPDKTMVEDEEEDYEDEEIRPPARKPKRIKSFSSHSSSDISTEAEGDTNASLRDLGLWRKALKPHQLNLFDELVTISHRLVRHLVSKEEAAANIVDGYRRRGQQLVDGLRASHIKEMKGYTESLRERKKRLESELKKCGEELANRGDEVDGVRKNVKKAGVERERGDAGTGLADVMTGFC